jgi:hypothetical protein
VALFCLLYAYFVLPPLSMHIVFLLCYVSLHTLSSSLRAFISDSCSTRVHGARALLTLCAPLSMRAWSAKTILFSYSSLSICRENETRVAVFLS